MAVPQGVRILDSRDRSSSEAANPAASQARRADRSQGGGLWDSFAGAATGSSAPSWFDDSVNVGASSSRSSAALRPDCRVQSLLRRSRCWRMMTSDKSPPSEGLRAVIRLLTQLCPSEPAAAQPTPQKVCDVEGLFGTAVAKPASGDIPLTLFHCVAELFADHRLKFQANLESGKLPASGLLSPHKGPGACEEPTLRSAAPFSSSFLLDRYFVI